MSKRSESDAPMTEHQDQLDRATQDRLAQLASMPVDVSRLEKKMAQAMPPKPESKPVPRGTRAIGWYRVAAVFVLFAGVAAASYYALFGVAPQDAVARTMTVAELHEQLVNAPPAAYLAHSTGQAQSLINAQLAGELRPPMVGGTRVESCCLVEGDFPLRAALVIKRPDATATIIIAQGDDFAHPMNPIEHPSGVQLQGHTHAGLPMVMRNEGGLWMCVMGQAENKVLADIAASLTLE